MFQYINGSVLSNCNEFLCVKVYHSFKQRKDSYMCYKYILGY